jgi:hypothetical protein
MDSDITAIILLFISLTSLKLQLSFPIRRHRTWCQVESRISGFKHTKLRVFTSSPTSAVVKHVVFLGGEQYLLVKRVHNPGAWTLLGFVGPGSWERWNSLGRGP